MVSLTYYIRRFGRELDALQERNAFFKSQSLQLHGQTEKNTFINFSHPETEEERKRQVACPKTNSACTLKSTSIVREAGSGVRTAGIDADMSAVYNLKLCRTSLPLSTGNPRRTTASSCNNMECKAMTSSVISTSICSWELVSFADGRIGSPDLTGPTIRHTATPATRTPGTGSLYLVHL